MSKGQDQRICFPNGPEAGTASFFKNGEECHRLRVLMEAKGTQYNTVTAQSVTQEDPWFLAFKPNSLKANITLLKKELGQWTNVKALRKLFFDYFVYLI
jgi:hypothetical protein